MHVPSSAAYTPLHFPCVTMQMRYVRYVQYAPQRPISAKQHNTHMRKGRDQHGEGRVSNQRVSVVLGSANVWQRKLLIEMWLCAVCGPLCAYCIQPA